MNILGLIPARGGSKGIPGKNIKMLLGKPLLQYTIDVAVESGLFTNLVVSTEDESIAEVADKLGVQVIKRPKELSEDHSAVTGVIEHALKACEEKFGVTYDSIMLLQPTAPLRTPTHLKDAVRLLKASSETACVISVCEMDDVHPARMYKKSEMGYLLPFVSDFEELRRQDIPPAYYRNGAIYLVRKQAFFNQKSVMAKPSLPYIMDKKYLANIDDPLDWVIAEALMTYLNEQHDCL